MTSINPEVDEEGRRPQFVITRDPVTINPPRDNNNLFLVGPSDLSSDLDFRVATIDNGFQRGWKLMSITRGSIRPQGLREWAAMIWGWDIWLGPIPFLKTSILINAIAVIVSRGR